MKEFSNTIKIQSIQSGLGDLDTLYADSRVELKFTTSTSSAGVSRRVSQGIVIDMVAKSLLIKYNEPQCVQITFTDQHGEKFILGDSDIPAIAYIIPHLNTCTLMISGVVTDISSSL